ncbi:hypothetical protein [Actinoplanes sp. NPDC051851]|uniref:hypothetical protein n=1 Tax=Actinoplanes sp. NPDC051851 TaxID=3154753 RepID=UPI0034268453
MSYAVAQPSPPVATRPPAVSATSGLLWGMGAAGLCYAIAAVAVAPGTVSRFRAAAIGDTAENFVSVVWLDAALAAVVAILAFALLVVLGVGVRRGSGVARIATLVVCAFGTFAGLGSLGVIALQRSGDPSPGSVGEVLGASYPEGWIGVTVIASVAQVAGYLLAGALLLAAPRVFFGISPAVPGAPYHPSGSSLGVSLPFSAGYAPPAQPGASPYAHPGFPPSRVPPSGDMSGYQPPAPFLPSAGYPSIGGVSQPPVPGTSTPTTAPQGSESSTVDRPTHGSDDDYWRRPSE